MALENIESWTGRLIESDGKYEGEGISFVPDDILFGKLRPYLAKAWLAAWSGEAVGDFHVLRCYAEHVPAFIQHVLLSRDIISQIDGSTHGAKMPRASWDFMGSIPIPVPSVSEQRAIAAFLDRETAKIDSLVVEQEQLIALLKEKRQAVISHAVTKGLDPNAPIKESGVDWFGSIPASWEVVSLKRDLEFLTSGSRGWADYYVDDGALFLRIGNLTREGLNLDLDDIQRVSVPDGTEGERTRVRPGDILFSITAFVGSVAVVPEALEEAYVSQHVALARVRRELWDPKWVGYSVLSHAGKSYLAAQCYGGSKIQLSLEDVANFQMTQPSLDEQRVIVQHIDREIREIGKLVSEAKLAIGFLKERRSALISAAVTGKIDVCGLVETAAPVQAAAA